MAECKASFTGTGPCKRRGHSAFPDGSAIAVTALLKPWWREAQRTSSGSSHLLMMAHRLRTSPASTKEMRMRAHFPASKSARPRKIDPIMKHRSEEHTSELQSLMRNSYAVFCLKKKNQ